MTDFLAYTWDPSTAQLTDVSAVRAAGQGTLTRRAFNLSSAAAVAHLFQPRLLRADEPKVVSSERRNASSLVESVREIGPAFGPNALRITGFDGATSIGLPDGRSLWTFGDTVEGPFVSIRELDLTHLLSNTALVARPPTVGSNVTDFEYLTTPDRTRARPILSTQGDEQLSQQRLWPVHGVCVGEWVYLYYHRITMDPRVDVFVSFQLDGMGVARARVGEWKFERLPAADGSFAWWKGNEPGFGVWVERRPDGWVYLWGSVMTGMFLARCREDQLDRGERYEYLVDGPSLKRPDARPRWVARWEPSEARFDHVPNEMSAQFNRHLGCYLAVHMWDRDNRIVLRTAPAVEGPWSEPIVCYEPPRERDDDFFYAAKAHPEISAENDRLLRITYVDSRRYVPQLIEVRLH